MAPAEKKGLKLALTVAGDRLVSGNFAGIRVVDLETGKALPGPKVIRDPFCPKTGIPDGCPYMYGRCVVRTASTHCFFYTAGGRSSPT